MFNGKKYIIKNEDELDHFEETFPNFFQIFLSKRSDPDPDLQHWCKPPSNSESTNTRYSMKTGSKKKTFPIHPMKTGSTMKTFPIYLMKTGSTKTTFLFTL